MGEYGILIPSAEERAGLETWLARAGHRPPEGVIPILDLDIVRGRRCFIPRRHPRHDAEHVPDDPRVRESAEHENVQGREFLRHPCRGGAPQRAAGEERPIDPRSRGRGRQVMAAAVAGRLGAAPELSAGSPIGPLPRRPQSSGIQPLMRRSAASFSAAGTAPLISLM